jgi:hypothetical protein
LSEGLSAAEVGKEIGEHSKHARAHEGGERHDRLIPIVEAVLLSVVALIAAWSGFSAAKWGTESSLKLAKASATRTKANRAALGDAVTMNAWLGAHFSGDANEVRVTEKRFLPELKIAFDAWIKTHPFTNPNAPAGPQAMPQYKPPGQAASVSLDQRADAYYAEGQKAAGTADKYIRATVILASVLFLVGISTQFPGRGVRIGLICVAGALLVFGVVEVLQLPGPPA